MILGQTMPCQEGGVTMYSAWIARRGNAATFVCETIGVSSKDLAFDVSVQHKNEGDDDSAATAAASFATIDAVGTTTVRFAGLKELVRFQYVAASDGPVPEDDWVHFRMLNPNWETNETAAAAQGVA